MWDKTIHVKDNPAREGTEYYFLFDGEKYGILLSKEVENIDEKKHEAIMACLDLLAFLEVLGAKEYAKRDPYELIGGKKGDLITEKMRTNSKREYTLVYDKD